MKSTKIAAVFTFALGSILIAPENCQAQDASADPASADLDAIKSDENSPAITIDWKKSLQKRFDENQRAAESLSELLNTDDVEKFKEGIDQVAGQLSDESNHRFKLMQISQELNSLANTKSDSKLQDGKSSAPSMSLKEAKSKVDEIAEQLAFQPKFESDIPEHFATPTPVGEIEIKKYKSYRMAKTPSSGRTAFFRLFNHIKKNDIEMTSPVQMTYDGDGDELAETEMAFLYPDSATEGSTEENEVEVIDTEPTTVISMGMRGRPSADEVEKSATILRNASDRFPIRNKLKDEVRLLGYNSPSVPAEDQFYEVQVEYLSDSEE